MMKDLDKAERLLTEADSILWSAKCSRTLDLQDTQYAIWKRLIDAQRALLAALKERP